MFIDILRSAENSAKVTKEIITYKADGNGSRYKKKRKNTQNLKQNNAKRKRQQEQKQNAKRRKKSLFFADMQTEKHKYKLKEFTRYYLKNSGTETTETML